MRRLPIERWGLCAVLLGSSLAAARPHPSIRLRLHATPAAKAGAKAANGSVAYLTSAHAYLDRGIADRLRPGAEIKLQRRGRPVGTCKIESVAEHSAVCGGTGIRRGDTFAIAPGTAEAAPSPLPPPSSEAELARRRAVVQNAQLPLVDFHGEVSRSTGAGGLNAEARVGDFSWAQAGSHFHQERVDVAIRGAPIGLGLRLSVDATALAWTDRPAQFLSPSLAAPQQLLVRQAELSFRDLGPAVTFSAGRLWPWHVPGIGVMDGAQVGWRAASGTLELGAFGGGIPDPVLTEPTFQRTAFGAYAAGQVTFDSNSALSHEERVSVNTAPEYGMRVEAEERVRAWLWRSLDLGADVRFGFGAAQAPGALDTARVDADWRVSSILRINGALRYAGNDALDIPPIGIATFGARSLHTDAAVVLSPWPWLSLSALGFTARDSQTALGRGMFGGEVALPALFNDRASVAVGALEERGWINGRSAYAQLVLLPAARLRLLARASVAQELTFGAPTAPPVLQLSGFLSVDFAILRWLAIRGSVFGQGDLAGDVAQLQLNNGLMGQVGLVAKL